MALRFPDLDRLSIKLIDYPLLHSFLRILLFERLFRVTLLGLVMLPLGLVLFLARIWTATPNGFSPVITINGLDYVQAWALRRSALKLQAKGQFDQALDSWIVAVANNPGNPRLLRGTLDNLRQGSHRSQTARAVVGYSRWLLRLTRTNLADLEISISVYERFGLDDLTLATLAPLENALTPSLEARYRKALFHCSRFSDFHKRCEQGQERGPRLTDPELALYTAAYDAGWGLLSEAAAGQARLDLAKQEPATSVLAHRLQLNVSERLVQPDTYRRSLEFLQDQRQDRLPDHIVYWQLLRAIGRKSQAVNLIASHVTPPASAEETVLLARACFDLGQGEQAKQILEQGAPRFAASEALWVAYSNLLIEQRRWDDLLKVALLIRRDDSPVRESLAAHSYFLEGLTELRRARQTSAAAIFAKIPAANRRSRLWKLILAEKLERLGFPEVAKNTLLAAQKEAPDDPEFWLRIVKTASDIQDSDLLLSAMTSAYKLRPDDNITRHNYAAALISTRQRADEALKLTSLVVAQHPNNVGCRLNHSLALLQNQQFSAAESILATIDPTGLAGAELATYYYGWFELYFAQHQFDEARQARQKIETQYLLPTEKQWLESASRQMGDDNPSQLPNS